MDLGAAKNEQFVSGVEELASPEQGLGTPSAELVVAALAGAGLGTWHYDAATDLTMWDAVASEILGYAPVPRASVGMAQVHPDDHERMLDLVVDCLQAGKPYEIQIRCV